MYKEIEAYDREKRLGKIVIIFGMQPLERATYFTVFSIIILCTRNSKVP